MGVGAVGETAVLGAGEYLGKEVGDFLFFHVHGAETADAGGVDDAAASAEGKHFGKGGGVPAGIVCGGDGSGAKVKPRFDGIDEGGLAHTGKPGKDGGPPPQRSAESVHVLPGGGGNDVALIAGTAVYHHEPAHQGAVLLVVNVEFVEHQDGGDTVSLGGRQETVNEDGGGDGMIDGDNKHRPVHVGGNDVGFLGEVGGAADDVIAPRLDGGDDAPFGAGFHVHLIAHRHGVCGAHAFHAETPADAAFNGFPPERRTMYQLPVDLMTVPFSISLLYMLLAGKLSELFSQKRYICRSESCFYLNESI